MITKTCAVSGQSFVVTEEDQAFYQKMGVPLPTLCPEERQRRRWCWRNERSLHKRKCDITGKLVLSIYAPEVDLVVYDNDYWWSAEWDPLAFGQDFDFNAPFFEQFASLQKKVPHFSLAYSKDTLENSDFCNQCGFLKNCYQVVNAMHSERCLYGKGFENCFDCMDCYKVYQSELCYEVSNGHNCHSCQYLYDSENCHECLYSSNLIGCRHCFGCTNLRNKEYYFGNEILDPETWKARVKTMKDQFAPTQLLEKLQSFAAEQGCPPLQQQHCEDCLGNYLSHCKDCWHCFDCAYTEKSSYCTDLKKSKQGAADHCYDVSFIGGGLSFAYDCMRVGLGAQNIAFCIDSVRGISDSYYCKMCGSNSKNLFGCIGVRQKENCILNKSYTAHEYDTLIKKIVQHMRETGEWGEFFPIELSPFGYNETVAQEYFPLTKEEALERGYKWKEEAGDSPRPTTPGVPSYDFGGDARDSVCDQVLYCEKSGKPYKIQKAELKFYQKMNLPIPRLHPDVRHQERMKLRNPRKLWKRKCSDCGEEMETTYGPERKERVLCEGCYLGVVH